MGPKPKSQAERFWPKVQQSDGCWIWTGSSMGAGYGKFMWVRGEETGAHRASYRLNVGTIPDGMDVCHRCDNPKCVRPDHLFLGTRTDNMRDARAKGRTRFVPLRGALNGRATITEDDVKSIRVRHASGATTQDLAREFAMTPENVAHIVARRTWVDVA